MYQGTSTCVTEPTHPPPNSFSSYLTSLSTNSWIFERTQLVGSMDSLANSIRQGTCSCVTDGSFKDSHGTAAWKIIDIDKPENSIDGQCITPGHPSQQNPYRSELSGLYA
jgi:hypothetical protein